MRLTGQLAIASGMSASWRPQFCSLSTSWRPRRPSRPGLRLLASA
jgi:hypothetical protein